MVQMDNRLKRRIRKDPNLADNVIDTYIEIDKLMNYYKTEIKVNESERDHHRENKELEEMFVCIGKIEAYSDNLFELQCLFEVLRGYHRDMEAK